MRDVLKIQLKNLQSVTEGASRLFVLVLQRLGVTVAGVYRQLLYRHCSEPLEYMAPVDRGTWARARETVHIYGNTRDRARGRVVWKHLGTLHTLS
jgi:hypothetical protein